MGILESMLAESETARQARNAAQGSFEKPIAPLTRHERPARRKVRGGLKTTVLRAAGAPHRAYTEDSVGGIYGASEWSLRAAMSDVLAWMEYQESLATK